MYRTALTHVCLIALWSLPILPGVARADDATESSDDARLRKDGFVKRYDGDLAEVWVNEADNRMFVFHHDGSFEHVYFSHRTTLDTKGVPAAERFVDYIVLWDKDFKAVRVTDRYGIPYTGSELEQTDDGVSFIEL